MMVEERLEESLQWSDYLRNCEECRVRTIVIDMQPWYKRTFLHSSCSHRCYRRRSPLWYSYLIYSRFGLCG
jgi:hypothetical protein